MEITERTMNKDLSPSHLRLHSHNIKAFPDSELIDDNKVKSDDELWPCSAKSSDDSENEDDSAPIDGEEDDNESIVSDVSSDCFEAITSSQQLLNYYNLFIKKNQKQQMTSDVALNESSSVTNKLDTLSKTVDLPDNVRNISNNNIKPGESLLPDVIKLRMTESGIEGTSCDDVEKVINVDVSKEVLEKDPNVMKSESKLRSVSPANMAPTKVQLDMPYNHQRLQRSDLKTKKLMQCRKVVVKDNRETEEAKETSKTSPDLLEEFDVYNIETAMPTIDWKAMEEQLARAVREQEMFEMQRTNREEIRRKLAMGMDADDYFGDQYARKPSLQARLQCGMNLQICFMNETANDQDSSTTSSALQQPTEGGNIASAPDEPPKEPSPPSSTLPTKEDDEGWVPLKPKVPPPQPAPKTGEEEKEEDFLSRQARLQAEARMALAQAQQMAHMQMEVERQKKKKSPLTEMVGIPFPDGRRRLTRQILSDMNVAQLQVIVNDLHTQIETLNEDLVRFLLDRDDLHMEQDSMLVDIEDLTRYLGAKHQKEDGSLVGSDESKDNSGGSCNEQNLPSRFAFKSKIKRK